MRNIKNNYEKPIENDTIKTKLTNNEIVLLYYDFLESLFTRFGCPDDLKQMVYLDLLEKDNDKLNAIHNRGELKYWLIRMVKNEGFSRTSKYYYLYTQYYERIKSFDEFSELPD